MTDLEHMTRSEKLRDALWRYAPERTERAATIAVVAGTMVAAVAGWLYRGRIPK